MNDPESNTKTNTSPSAAVCADAAAWIAKLHSEDRTLQVEAGFRRWLAADDAHRTAFEMANDLWTTAERWPRTELLPTPRIRPRNPTIWRRTMAAAAACLMVAGAGLVYHLRDPAIETAVGEQRTLTLDDGSRVTLNTQTRVSWHYDKAYRLLKLEQGEAYFEVAQHTGWPFIVTAGRRSVRALGTAFVVRKDSQEVTVTLLEGKVSVLSEVSESKLPTTSVPLKTSLGAYTLFPGQRLTFLATHAPRLDQPVTAGVTAWQRGQVAFDHTSLIDAVAEMNRYSKTKLELDEAEEGDGIKMTGTFRAGESMEFAQAVAEAYAFTITETGGKIVLSASR